ncbi:MAG: hypothetical protein A2138_21450 [Deltaproteobacteria bacterium RBG_16_71_12]|nr:MAG: hypothetical protein A2138_21450 [Deltaproteobacteria bacterium RBG_16_71_12]
MAARTRLVLALATSGLALGALAGARLDHPWWAAALAPAPLLVAVRCLPLSLGLALALLLGVTARALGAVGVEGASLADGALGGLVLVPALLSDRSCVTRWPHLGGLAFPLAVVAVDAGLRALDVPVAALPVGDAGPLGSWARQLGWAVPPVACAAVAQAVAGLSSVGNWHRADPLPQEVREAGVRLWAVAATLLMVALSAVAPLLPRASG